MFLKRFSVRSVEENSVTKFFSQERLEKGEDHLEDIGLVDNMETFYSNGDGILEEQ